MSLIQSGEFSQQIVFQCGKVDKQITTKDCLHSFYCLRNYPFRIQTKNICYNTHVAREDATLLMFLVIRMIVITLALFITCIPAVLPVHSIIRHWILES